MRTGRTFPFRPLLVLVLAAALAAPTRATAGFTLVTSESALGANDSVDWASLGSFTKPSFSLTSQSGTPIDGAVSLFGQSGSYFGLGSLNGSTALVGVAAAIGSDSGVEFTFNFPQPVFAFGADISTVTNQAEAFASLIAKDTQGNTQIFDLTNNSQGGFEFSGFAGVRSNTASLASLSFFVYSGNVQVAGTQLTIGKAELDSPTASSAPAPGGLTLAGIGLVGLLGYAWRRRKPVAA
jgi:hypothetical protein